MKKFYPVIHCYDGATDNKNIKTAIDNGADGIFLINHGVLSDYSFELSVRNACARYKIGANFLNLSNIEALEKAVDFGLDMLWVDNAGCDDCENLQSAEDFFKRSCELDDNMEVEIFGGIHFKYQPEPKSSIEDSLYQSLAYIDVPTLSGSATGSPANIEFVQRAYSALEARNNTYWPDKGDRSLAIASGISIDNANEYLPYIDKFLVASSIEEKLKMLREMIHSFKENHES